MKLKLQCKSERKIVANAISQATNQTAVYAKTPTYAYNIGDWHIDRQGVITTAVTDEMETALDVLKEHITNDISFVLESFPKSSSNRIRNILEVKGTLIEKAIDSKINLLIEKNYCEINCKFDESNFDLISSVAIFMLKLSELALSQAKIIRTSLKFTKFHFMLRYPPRKTPVCRRRLPCLKQNFVNFRSQIFYCLFALHS